MNPSHIKRAGLDCFEVSLKNRIGIKKLGGLSSQQDVSEAWLFVGVVLE